MNTLKSIVIGTSLTETSDDVVRAGAAIARATGAIPGSSTPTPCRLSRPSSERWTPPGSETTFVSDETPAEFSSPEQTAGDAGVKHDYRLCEIAGASAPARFPTI
jgi:hypothetical protein